eukprot:3306558-Rhodomonas_salina.2
MLCQYRTGACEGYASIGHGHTVRQVSNARIQYALPVPDKRTQYVMPVLDKRMRYAMPVLEVTNLAQPHPDRSEKRARGRIWKQHSIAGVRAVQRMPVLDIL